MLRIFKILYIHFVINFRFLLSICGLHFWCPLNLKMLPTPLHCTQVHDMWLFGPLVLSSMQNICVKILLLCAKKNINVKQIVKIKTRFIND